MPRTAIITADLHYGITSPERIISLKNEMLKLSPNLLIIAGDIGEPAPNFEKCLDVFFEMPCPVGIVIGNHDLYATGGNHSEDLWAEILPGIVKKYGFIWMEDENIVIGDTAFVGTLAWYDYSSRAREFAMLPDEYYHFNKPDMVADGTYIDWGRKDTEFASELLEGLLKRLSAAQEDPKIRQIVLVTHVPLFREHMVRLPTDNIRAEAYFGNLTAGLKSLEFPKITYIISGHTHRNADKKVGNIRVKVLPSDYRRPSFVSFHF